MNNKLIVITGGSDGLGKSGAEQLLAKGHEVVITGQSAEKTKRVAAELNIKSYVTDFSKLSQVRSLAHQLNRDYPRIDILVNNAGAIFGDRKVTPDGFEITHQVNYLAPFLLTNLLLPNLIQASATVIQTASTAARMFGKLDINDLQNEKNYSPNRAYGDSKLADILFTRELDRRYRAKGIKTVSFHPGNLSTNFGKHTTSWFRFMYDTFLSKLVLTSAKKGGDALVWLVEGQPAVDWQLGQYYEDNKLASKQNPLATDMELANELWQRTTKALGILE